MLSWGIPALLLATMVNQLPIISAFVPTEPVYVYLGTQLPQGGWSSILACMLGAWIGAQASFWLGRLAGARVLARMDAAPGAMARARRLFMRRGAPFVVLAQLIWPIATLSQVLAGAWGMRPLTYLAVSALGAVLAVAQYVAIGYATARGLAAFGLEPGDSLLIWLSPYWVLIGLAAILLLGTALILRQTRHALSIRIAYSVVLALAMFVAVNLGTLTARVEAVERVAPVPLATACRALDETLVARTGETPLHEAQPVNLALIGFDDPARLLESLGWLRNRTYARGDLEPLEILVLTLRGLPPASSLLLEGIATDLAWQEERGAVPRTQLRLWPVAMPEGAPAVQLASVGRIDAVTLRLQGRVPVLAYDLFPYTDTARNREAEVITRAVPGVRWRLAGPATRAESDWQFESDGRIAVLTAPGAPDLATLCEGVAR